LVLLLAGGRLVAVGLSLFGVKKRRKNRHRSDAVGLFASLWSQKEGHSRKQPLANKTATPRQTAVCQTGEA
jgi:hypothetical protein